MAHNIFGPSAVATGRGRRFSGVSAKQFPDFRRDREGLPHGQVSGVATRVFVIGWEMARLVIDLSVPFQACPIRRAGQHGLARGAAPVPERAGPEPRPLPRELHHRAVPEVAGLIEGSKEGRLRSCAKGSEALTMLPDWLGARSARTGGCGWTGGRIV